MDVAIFGRRGPALHHHAVGVHLQEVGMIVIHGRLDGADMIAHDEVFDIDVTGHHHGLEGVSIECPGLDGVPDCVVGNLDAEHP